MANMDVKQLQETGRNIVKAAESGDPSSTILAMLAPLENFKATEDLLRQSKIGVAVTKLRQNKDPKISEAASRLVNRWKQDVKKKRPAESSPATSNKALNGAATNGRSSGTQSPAPPSASPVVKKEAARRSTVDPDKRNVTTDGVEYKVTGDATRDACLKLMYDGIAFMSEESPDVVLDVARKVELAAFELYNNQTNADYKAKMRSLFQNLKIKGNTVLRSNVCSLEIDPKKFVTMTSDELKSAEKRASDAAIVKENLNNAMTPKEEKAISTTMTCSRCKQSRVAYTQAQTRSADEPLTTFCDCQVCGHKWKFS